MVPGPGEAPYSACTQGESSWRSRYLEIRILSSLLAHFRSSAPEGLEVHHTHLGNSLGNRSALGLHMKALELHMKVLELHMKALELHMKA